jgi:MYXO-CTERM domain-containing protein
MRSSCRLAAPAALALTLAAAPALAVTTEPNGTIIPRDSMNGEVQLYSLFQQLGDPVDWQNDSGVKPDQFSPLCNFTATFVLNEAGSHFGLAWYNSTNVAPTPADLIMIMPPNSPVGTVINSANIINDPNYRGGLIGFALIGGQTHYSEARWDPVCTGCNPVAPWIAAVIYASKNKPNAFYLAFEDGNFGPNPGDFNNDGDFNDDVFLLTGLTCAGGGLPCDTGMMGLCQSGITQCTPNGIVCTPINQPNPKESCNGFDDDCNGITDEGDLCQPGFVCDKGMCVEACSGEIPCAATLVCDKSGYCVDPLCAAVDCPSGQVCIAGVCKGPCDDIVCPFPEVCRVGKCLDPCAGMMCPMGQVCEQGVCIAACNCAPCAMGKACDTNTGSCVEPLCVGVPCPMGQHCVAGGCVDNCMGAKCPSGEKCEMGDCVPDPNASGSGGSSGTGMFVGSGPTGAGGAMGSGNGVGGEDGGVKPHGCGCRVGEKDADYGAIVAAALAAVALLRRRR